MLCGKFKMKQHFNVVLIVLCGASVFDYLSWYAPCFSSSLSFIFFFFCFFNKNINREVGRLTLSFAKSDDDKLVRPHTATHTVGVYQTRFRFGAVVVHVRVRPPLQKRNEKKRFPSKQNEDDIESVDI